MTKGKLYEETLNVKDEDYYEQLLDEAKKEFPADAHGLRVDEVMPWFWKHFGDGEENEMKKL